MRKAFDKSSHHYTNTMTQGVDPIPLSSVYEVDRLKSERETPELQPHLKPRSLYAAQQSVIEADAREEKIQFAEERLDMAREEFEHDFDHAAETQGR